MPSLSMADLDIGIQDADIDVQVTPENPEPYQDVTIGLTSYATDLNKADIEWKNGTKTVLSGTGRTKYSFKALGPSSPSTFKITIRPIEGGDSIVKQVSINPSDIEVIWESVNGYTPPFYKGKSFPSSEGIIKVVAVPNIISPTSGKNVTYTWKNKDGALQDASGFNKNSYTFQNQAINGSESISVLASSLDGQYNATKTVDIPIVEPKIIFYKKSPVDGILYNKALIDDVSMPEDEMTIVAEPYFLAYKGSEDRFTYNWQINNEDIPTPTKQRELTVAPTERGGYATINLVMENLNTLYQKVTGKLRINL